MHVNPRFRTATINVRSNPEMSQARVRHDVQRAAHAAGLIGWQEMAPDRYRDAIRNLGPEWGHYMPHDGGLQLPIPISWKKDKWKKLDAGFVRTHHGKAGVSPNRYITWVKLAHRATGQEIVRINTHFVSGAWRGDKPETPWRREMWNRHLDTLRDLVARFEKQGQTVVLGGDFNRDSYRVMGDRMKYDNDRFEPTIGKSTLDYLLHSRNGTLQRLDSRVQGGYASDHDAVVARFRIRAAGPA